MKTLLLALSLLLPINTFALSELVAKAVNVEKCNGTLQLHSYPVDSPQAFDKRYGLKFIHSGKCEKMVITVGGSVQILNLKSGTIINFSNYTMSEYLSNEEDNTMNVHFFSNGKVAGPLPAYTISNDVLELK